MKKLLSAAVLSFVLFGTASVLNFENKNFEVRDLLGETFTNEAVGRRVNVRRANEVTPSVAEAVKVQQRYDSESGTYDFRFVAGVNTVNIDSAKITITLNEKTASKSIYNAYERIQVGEEEKTAAEVFGEGYNYLLAYVLTDVPTNAVSSQFNVNVGLVSGEEVIADAARDVKLSDIIDLDFEPSIEFANNDSLAVVAGSAVELPSYTLTNSVDTTYTVNITSNGNGVIENGTYTPDQYSESGVHTLTYTAVHSHTGKEIVLGHRDVNVYRKLFRNAGDWSVENELAPNEEQVASTTNTGFGTVELNYSASTNYYIETEIIMPTNHNGGHHVGISNYSQYNQSQFLVFDLDLGDYNWRVKNFKTSGDGSWNLDNEVDNWRLGEYFDRSISKSDTKVKLAVAREGSCFYMFVNDEYLTMTTDNDYSYEPSYPGLFTHAGNEGSKFTKINYISGSENVQAKINELTDNGSSMISSYVARGYDWAFDSKNTDNRNFTVNPYSEERGVNFDFTNETTHHNGGMVSLYQYLDGNFKFEFDYKPTSESTPTANDCKMWLEARPMDYSSEIFWIGTKFRDSDAEQMLKGILTEPAGEIWNTTTITNPRAGMHYEVIRTVGETNSTFELRIVSLADPTQVVEFTVAYSGQAWNDKLILIWHNTNLAGQFSNIKLSVD